MTSLSPFDQRELRRVLGTFVTGVTVVTTRDSEGRPYGATANSFSSVSLDPPLILWSQSLTSRSHPAFRDSDCFAVNILPCLKPNPALVFINSNMASPRAVSVIFMRANSHN